MWAGAESVDKTLTTSWKRQDFKLFVPSILNKTLGTNDDDYVTVMFRLPTNTGFVIDIALPQWEAGDVPTAFDLRPLAQDELLAASYLQKIGLAATGSWSNRGATVLAQRLNIPMWRAPKISADGSRVTIRTPGRGTFTATATAELVAASKYGVVWTAGGFSGATAGEDAICQTDYLIVSAEL